MTIAPITDEAICQVVRSVIPAAAAKGGVTPAMNLRTDLGVDSIGLMSIVFLIEEETGFDASGHVQDLMQVERVADIIRIVRQG
jgi:acyl carrier protein